MRDPAVAGMTKELDRQPNLPLRFDLRKTSKFRRY